MSVEQDVIAFVVDFIRQNHPLADDGNLAELRYIEQGLVSSLGIMRLVFDLEERFGVRFDEAEITDCRFQTLGGLAALITAKANSSGKG